MQKWWGVLLFTLATIASAQGQLVPEGAIWKDQHIQKEYQPVTFMAEKGFDHLLGWINVATVKSSSGAQSSLEIREFKLLEQTPTGAIRVVQTLDFGRGTGGNLTGGLWNRNRPTGDPFWFRTGQPSVEPTIADVRGNAYHVNMGDAPQYVYHAWTEPRIPANPKSRYLIEATFRVTGEARIQFGVDYWKGAGSAYTGWSAGCVTSNNCEAWISDWFGDTGGKFVTVRTPKKL